MSPIKIFFLTLIAGFQVAQAECNSSHMLALNAHSALNAEGNVQVRENDILGDDLHLHDQLGMNAFWSLGLVYGYCLDGSWLDFAYTKFIVTGSANHTSGFNFNGAVYAPGKTDIKKTDYRKLSILYRRTMSGERTSLEYSAWGGGITVETLKFYIDGTLSPSTTRFEKFEAFDRQLMPVPTLLYTYAQALKDRWGYSLDLQFSYLPKFKTPYTEMGNIFFEQYNFDGKLGLVHSFEASLLEIGLQNKFFRQKGYSQEDTNEFSINSTGLFAEWRQFF